MALLTDIALKITADLSKASDLGNPVQELRYFNQVQLSSGVGAGKADLLFSDSRQLAASASEDLDLTGSLTDALGTTFAAARIKAITIKALSANTNNVIVGAASANQWASLLGTTGTLIIRPGTTLSIFCGSADATGYTVTAGTGDLLKIANSGAGSEVNYEIVLVGVSA